MMGGQGDGGRRFSHLLFAGPAGGGGARGGRGSLVVLYAPYIGALRTVKLVRHVDVVVVDLGRSACQGKL